MPDRGDQLPDVVVVHACGGVAEVDGDAVGEAGRQEKNTSFPAWAGQFTSAQAVTAASQSMAAIGTPPPVECSMKRPASRCGPGTRRC